MLQALWYGVGQTDLARNLQGLYVAEKGFLSPGILCLQSVLAHEHTQHFALGVQ